MERAGTAPGVFPCLSFSWDPFREGGAPGDVAQSVLSGGVSVSPGVFQALKGTAPGQKCSLFFFFFRVRRSSQSLPEGFPAGRGVARGRAKRPEAEKRKSGAVERKVKAGQRGTDPTSTCAT